eukprot:CAMPEP_0185574060 /NCGR_PEP_ID=MMETSP0434-20130131/5622_1 /TAXON_ID=626734 ORGANISM="Favella taraikaensis, Strain Fe Narragansett Bay" /NCGR_SAMPLE_ID=MMETSP0434 /ASSEMBLY_ACC=CAM_ASM_000379 /LENGTH=77 /DNA_ID=CAMNT_0028190503 /DNA_START=996 /DNA_END=1229 /DNA_ORIENTATION=-
MTYCSEAGRVYAARSCSLNKTQHDAHGNYSRSILEERYEGMKAEAAAHRKDPKAQNLLNTKSVGNFTYNEGSDDSTD